MDQRYRSKGALVPALVQRTTGPGWGSDNSTLSYRNGSGVVQEMWDYVTPGWHRRTGTTFVFNPLQLKRATVSNGGSGFYVYNNAEPGLSWEQVKGNAIYLFLPWFYEDFVQVKVHKYVPKYSVVPWADISEAQVEVSTKVMSERSRSNINTSENLAEIRSTASVVGDLTSKFLNFTKRSKFGKVLTAAEVYLMYRYGIKPLLSDLETLRVNLLRNVKPAHVTTRSTITLSSTNVVATTASYGILRGNMSTETTETVRIRAMSLDEALADAQFTYGLSAKQLLTLPWELVNLSFVADWFVNFGDFLGAMADSCVGTRNLGSCIVQEHVNSKFYSLSNVYNSQTSWYTLTVIPQGWHRNDTFHKERIVGLRSPSLTIKSDFRFDQLTRALDALSLAAVQLKGFSRGRLLT